MCFPVSSVQFFVAPWLEPAPPPPPRVCKPPSPILWRSLMPLLWPVIPKSRSLIRRCQSYCAPPLLVGVGSVQSVMVTIQSINWSLTADVSAFRSEDPPCEGWGVDGKPCRPCADLHFNTKLRDSSTCVYGEGKKNLFP